MKEKIKFPVLSRPFARLVVVGVACLAAAMPFVASTSLAFDEFSASAYGTQAFVKGAGVTVISGPTAPVSIGPGCGTAQVGAMASGTVAAVNVSPTMQTGVINTTAASTANSATATADVHQISLLGGGTSGMAPLITADEVEAVSTTSEDATGLHVSAAGSNLVNLVVAGTSITAVPAPNTTIQLAGFGRVVLNEQIVSPGNTGLTVNMIHVFVTVANSLNIQVGTQIIVSHAFSHITQIGGPGSLDGLAYGTTVKGTLVKSSPTAPASVGCQGNPKVTNTLVGINVTGAAIGMPSLVVLNSGTITDTAEGSVTASLSSAETTSTIQTASLLNGTVTATVVTDEADASTTDGVTFNFSTSGSFATLVVAGHPEITANVAPNTTVSLAGIGTLYLHRVIQGSNNIEIRMIEVVLSAGNVFGLPTNTDIIVASSSASLHSPTHP